MTYTVSQINDFIKDVIEGTSELRDLYVKGEITNCNKYASGHLYFSIKDENAQLQVVMFRGYASRLPFKVENGMNVIIKGSISVYAKTGVYQLYASDMIPDGIGSLYLAYEQLKKRLESEGYFDKSHKKDIPKFPKKIGVITSDTGAAVRDVINITGRRWPSAQIYLYPSKVQGVEAEGELISGLEYFEKHKNVDVIIIGRGGGSIEDLWVFNSENLAKMIYKSSTPIVSAVGHETDFTIADFVADLRAPTPSAAAELVVPDSNALKNKLRDLDKIMRNNLISRINQNEHQCLLLENNLKDRMENKIRDVKNKLVGFNLNEKMNNIIKFKKAKIDSNDLERIMRNDLINKINDNKRQCEILEENIQESVEDKIKELKNTMDGINLDDKMNNILKFKSTELSSMVKLLNAVNPLAVMERGFSIIEKEDKVITDSKKVKVNDEVKIKLKTGALKATVTEIIKE